MKKRENTEEEKRSRALHMAEELGEKEELSAEKLSETEEKARGFLANPALRKVREKLELMIALLRNPHVSKIVLTSIVGALLYLILPADVIPDVIPFVGLLDDVFVLSAIFDRAVKTIKKEPEKIGDIVDSMPERLKKPALSLLGAAGGAYAGWKGGEALAAELENRRLNDVIDGTLAYVRRSISQKIRAEEKKAFIKRFASSFFSLSLFLMSALITAVEPEESKLWILSLIILILSYSTGVFSFISGFRVFLSSLRTARKEKGLRNGMRRMIRDRVVLYGPTMDLLSEMKGKWSFVPDEDEIERLALKSVRFFWLDIALFIIVTGLIVLGFFMMRMFIRSYADFELSFWKLLLFPVFYR